MRDVIASLAELRVICAQTDGTLKTASDLARYQRVIDTTRPQVIIETGLAHGGSARWFAERVECVLSVELNEEYVDAVGEELPSNVMVFLADSLDPEYVQAVEFETAWAARRMVSLDSNHSTQHVLAEMRLWGPLVTPGCYLVVEDGVFAYMPEDERARHYVQGHPLAAIEAYLADHDDFTPDLALEDLFETTQHPQGWLRKRS